MDRNVLLAFVLSTVVFLGWLMLEGKRPRPAPQAPASQVEASEVEKGGAGVPGPTAETARHEAAAKPPRPEKPAKAPVEPAAAEWTHSYDQGLYRAELSNRGAVLRAWTLTEYDARTPQGVAPVELVHVEDARGGALATPFEELGLGDLSDAAYQVESTDADGAAFVLRRGGIVIRKEFHFERESYGFHFGVEVENGSDRDVSPRFELRWPAAVREGQDFREESLVAYLDGSVKRQPVRGIGKPGFIGSLFGGGGPPEVKTLLGEVDWAGVDNRYFLAAVIPDRGREAAIRFEPLEPGTVGATALSFEEADLPPGQTLRHDFEGYIGPKEPARLDAVAEGLEHSINRGYTWVSPLTRFFEWMLKACHSVIPNYGIAIILLTVLVRLVTMPIMNRQMRSMERMRKVQPMLKEIQEKHADDRQKQSEEMMKLYRREGVNPLGGCLPMLLQFPVFIGLFYALQSSIALRHAGFFGWIDDLAAPESLFTIPGLGIPFRVLPLVMGATMVLQQRFTPTTVDPAQARMMMTIMPIMFTVLFYQFPSGLVLYWMVSNLLGIANQLWIRRRMEAA